MSRNALILLLMLAAAVYGGAKIYAYVAATQRVEQLVSPLAGVGEFRYSGLSASLRGPIRVKNARLELQEGGIIRFEKLALLRHEWDDARPLPTEFLLRAEGMEFDATVVRPLRDNQIPEGLRTLGLTQLVRDMLDPARLGYGTLRLDLEMEVDQDTKTGVYTVAVREDAPGLGNSELRLDLSGVKSAPGPFGIDGWLRNASFNFQDAGYTEHLMGFYAAQNNQVVDEFRADLVARLTELLSQHQLQLTARDVANLQRFILTPGTLQIRLEPDGPVQLSSLPLYNPADLPELLALSIRAQ
jgi:hypothetical protein